LALPYVEVPFDHRQTIICLTGEEQTHPAELPPSPSRPAVTRRHGGGVFPRQRAGSWSPVMPVIPGPSPAGGDTRPWQNATGGQVVSARFLTPSSAIGGASNRRVFSGRWATSAGRTWVARQVILAGIARHAGVARPMERSHTGQGVGVRRLLACVGSRTSATRISHSRRHTGRAGRMAHRIKDRLTREPRTAGKRGTPHPHRSARRTARALDAAEVGGAGIPAASAVGGVIRDVHTRIVAKLERGRRTCG